MTHNIRVEIATNVGYKNNGIETDGVEITPLNYLFTIYNVSKLPIFSKIVGLLGVSTLDSMFGTGLAFNSSGV